MDGSSVEKMGPLELARMLRLDAEAETPWSDWAEAVEHQLSASLLPDLSSVRGAERKRLEKLVAGRLGAESFLRQLTFVTPSMELLVAIKRFGREKRDDKTNGLCGNGGTLLYFAAIAAAVGRCGERITQLSDEQLVTGFRWGLEQPVTALHEVFAVGLKAVEKAL